MLKIFRYSRLFICYTVFIFILEPLSYCALMGSTLLTNQFIKTLPSIKIQPDTQQNHNEIKNIYKQLNLNQQKNYVDFESSGVKIKTEEKKKIQNTNLQQSSKSKYKQQFFPKTQITQQNQASKPKLVFGYKQNPTHVAGYSNTASISSTSNDPIPQNSATTSTFISDSTIIQSPGYPFSLYSTSTPPYSNYNPYIYSYSPQIFQPYPTNSYFYYSSPTPSPPTIPPIYSFVYYPQIKSSSNINLNSNNVNNVNNINNQNKPITNQNNKNTIPNSTQILITSKNNNNPTITIKNSDPTQQLSNIYNNIADNVNKQILDILNFQASMKRNINTDTNSNSNSNTNVNPNNYNQVINDGANSIQTYNYTKMSNNNNNNFQNTNVKPTLSSYPSFNLDQTNKINQNNILKNTQSPINTQNNLVTISQNTQIQAPKQPSRQVYVGSRELQINSTNKSTTSQNNFTLPIIPTIKITYNQYLKKYNTKFQQISNPDIKAYRQQIYTQNLDLINGNNINKRRTFNMAINSFCQYTSDQFIKMYGKLKVPQDIVRAASLEQAIRRRNSFNFNYSTPQNIKIDWRCKISSVSQKKQCKSYIYQALDTIYITMRIFNNLIVDLSFQQILSCNKEDSRNACSNGFYSGAYDYIKKNGIGLNWQYPQDNNSQLLGIVSDCNRIIQSPQYRFAKFFIKDSNRIQSGNCWEMVKILQSRAISVSIAIDNFQFYKEGTIKTSSKQINHGVILIGYDPIKGYLIKNSWGREWGMEGYAYIDQSVGICNYAYYPTLNQEKQRPSLCSQKI